MGDLKYKVGDKVRIKSIDWYNENKDEFGNIGHFSLEMAQFCGQITIISEETPIYYRMENIDNFLWTDEMIEGLVEDGTIVDYVKESNDRYRIVIDPRFDIEVDEGEYYAVRRKKEYPKTYEECCEVLSIQSYYKLRYYTYEHGYNEYATSNKLCSLQDKLNILGKLIICRYTYWKIYGEEMGLEKPWQPDYKKERYVISRYIDEIVKGYRQAGLIEHFILEFPTEEMRDAFFNAFRDEIENCKELL